MGSVAMDADTAISKAKTSRWPLLQPFSLQDRIVNDSRYVDLVAYEFPAAAEDLFSESFLRRCRLTDKECSCIVRRRKHYVTGVLGDGASADDVVSAMVPTLRFAALREKIRQNTTSGHLTATGSATTNGASSAIRPQLLAKHDAQLVIATGAFAIGT